MKDFRFFRQNGFTFMAYASFSLLTVSPASLPWGREKSFGVNFHSRERSVSTRGIFRGFRKTTSTMMGSEGKWGGVMKHH